MKLDSNQGPPQTLKLSYYGPGLRLDGRQLRNSWCYWHGFGFWCSLVVSRELSQICLHWFWIAPVSVSGRVSPSTSQHHWVWRQAMVLTLVSISLKSPFDVDFCDNSLVIDPNNNATPFKVMSSTGSLKMHALSKSFCCWISLNRRQRVDLVTAPTK